MDDWMQPVSRGELPRREAMQTPEEVAATLRLKALGWGVRRIAGELGCSHMTVRRYLAEGGCSVRCIGCDVPSSITIASSAMCDGIRSESQVRIRLAAGGNRIRTLGPPQGTSVLYLVPHVHTLVTGPCNEATVFVPHALATAPVRRQPMIFAAIRSSSASISCSAAGVTNTTIPSVPASSYCLITSGSAGTGAATTTIDRGLRPNSRANLSSIARPSRICSGV